MLLTGVGEAGVCGIMVVGKSKGIAINRCGNINIWSEDIHRCEVIEIGDWRSIAL